MSAPRFGCGFATRRSMLAGERRGEQFVNGCAPSTCAAPVQSGKQLTLVPRRDTRSGLQLFANDFSHLRWLNLRQTFSPAQALAGRLVMVNTSARHADHPMRGPMWQPGPISPMRAEE